MYLSLIFGRGIFIYNNFQLKLKYMLSTFLMYAFNTIDLSYHIIQIYLHITNVTDILLD